MNYGAMPEFFPKAMPDWISALFSPKTIIYYGGMLLLLAVVFAETGLMIGILFPGDSLIFTAGLLTRVDILQHDWPVVAGLIALAAFLGDQSGYFIGWRTGRALFQRPKSLLFRPEYVTMTRNFYQKYGAWVLILGKFLPVIRTFAPLLAGVVEMRYPIFVLMSALGSAAWPFTLVPIGYYLGGLPWVEANYHWIILGLVLVTTGPVIIRLITAARNKAISIQP
jgi:membrane-associated protein